MALRFMAVRPSLLRGRRTTKKRGCAVAGYSRSSSEFYLHSTHRAPWSAQTPRLARPRIVDTTTCVSPIMSSAPLPESLRPTRRTWHVSAEWMKWWGQADRPSVVPSHRRPVSAKERSGAPRVHFDAQQLAALNEKYAQRWKALWSVAASRMAGGSGRERSGRCRSRARARSALSRARMERVAVLRAHEAELCWSATI